MSNISDLTLKLLESGRRQESAHLAQQAITQGSLRGDVPVVDINQAYERATADIIDASNAIENLVAELHNKIRALDDELRLQRTRNLPILKVSDLTEDMKVIVRYRGRWNICRVQMGADGDYFLRNSAIHCLAGDAETIALLTRPGDAEWNTAATPASDQQQAPAQEEQKPGPLQALLTAAQDYGKDEETSPAQYIVADVLREVFEAAIEATNE
ncbi:hypothetical protein [Nesterenkonia rhizosphaerae]|uniref:Ead/Ea22-like family protein n=1 Tax=Nesterenkonia rhizosphaerae TaxID=1348272 RepID=A0ABP9FTU9_9MICC